ncbi:Coenzyme F420 hydrogenase/dehydrogenase, beta subunit C-terminal domain [Eubacterium sp. MSJ-33]|uniref:Coenzyme F420 hydrogenase/dehydrogenase, beta subunit C-terminal domain n=1 Tax=Eubacterium sp. MSJ-33 TaxID=2841528 RepID=UPI001C784255|nr:Coenzyme F420 hydrogenase/dehydrogenase, beta subunit C-terminal domain [Eubacterium sp. MSJ-33]QWT54144.1 Coenzyme F420 hydrogenase/dehydrogenase, beta subunit C-terminal domain [Eubacterium sp. MSJ-33]
MKPLKTYACCIKNEAVRINSSSGGVFSILAAYIFSLKGIVYGVAMNTDCYSASFYSASSLDELDNLRGSKYVQAGIGDTYKKVKRDLTEGRIVLFTGTPCQVNGLKKYLGADYENLICADVICHGAPSPKLWKKYVYYQEEKHNAKLTYVNFRCKDKGWAEYGMKMSYRDPFTGKSISEFVSKETDPYMLVFLRNYALRPSCYRCVARETKLSDITIADFWGIDNVASRMNDNKGTSLVLIRTKKGEKLFENVCNDMKIREVTYEAGVNGNPSDYKSPVRPSQRDGFYHDLNQLKFSDLIFKYAKPSKLSLKTKIKMKLKPVVAPVLKVIRDRRDGY